jgi:hypothetical protein
MRTNRKVTLVILLAAAILVCIAVLTRDQEPYYHGHSLSDWFRIYRTNVENEDPESKTKADEAKIAIATIGTNALPILLKRIRYEASPARDKIAAAVEKLPHYVRGNKLVGNIINTDRSFQAAEDAASIFLLLRSQASPVIPQLSVLMQDTKRPNTAARAVYCLAAIGQDGLPSLLTALASPQLPCCKKAASYLGSGPHFDFGTNAAAAIPLLARLASNTNEPLAKTAIRAIGHLHLEPQVAIPALTNALCSPNLGVRCQAAMSLEPFGAEARGAIPALRTALADRSPGVRMAATNTLLQIAPEALR